MKTNDGWLDHTPKRTMTKLTNSMDMEPLAKHHWLFFMSKALRVNTSIKVNAKTYTFIRNPWYAWHQNHHNSMQVICERNSPYPDPDITTTNHETPPFASQNDCPTFIIEETCNHPRLTQPQHMYKCYWLAWHTRLMRTWRPHIYHVPLSKAIM